MFNQLKEGELFLVYLFVHVPQDKDSDERQEYAFEAWKPKETISTSNNPLLAGSPLTSKPLSDWQKAVCAFYCFATRQASEYARTPSVFIDIYLFRFSRLQLLRQTNIGNLILILVRS